MTLISTSIVGKTAGAVLPTPFPVAENLCQVRVNEAVNSDYRLLLADAGEPALSAHAGQFFHLLCPHTETDRPFLRRPMSIYRIDRDAAQIGFLYKVTGAGTRGLATLQPGDTLNALGPLGRSFTVPQGAGHVLMVARGVGLATLAPLAEAAKRQGQRVTAFLSARSSDLLMSREELERAGATVFEVTDTDGSSDVDRLKAAIAAVHAHDPFGYAATCGSERLLRLVRGLCGDWDIPGEVALEARMGCGTGMCYACVVPVTTKDGDKAFQRVCLDGPVFSVREATAW